MLAFENQNIEFKQEYVPDIRKEVMGFANAEGGTVYVGVRKDGVQYAQENGSITRKEVEDLIGAGTTKAFRLLKELCEAGKLEQKGNGRLSTYVTK